MYDNFTRGGQTVLHKIRMFFQIFVRTSIIAAFISFIFFGLNFNGFKNMLNVHNISSRTKNYKALRVNKPPYKTTPTRHLFIASVLQLANYKQF